MNKYIAFDLYRQNDQGGHQIDVHGRRDVYLASDVDQRTAELEAALRAARRSHYTCEDCWYSCPRAEDGCCDESQGPECNCGADEHNARIDNALMDGSSHG